MIVKVKYYTKKVHSIFKGELQLYTQLYYLISFKYNRY